ncbi:hypothetical protein A2617_00795 [Candidatus Daviesbacteria bacterium RIFOXYD1_FULL_41_10]|uniref:Uncharacterized protein n=1 Tax=Candidatus Daviesbacteria bacterium RIFOXYD1_FULL_41_10 TaxID=1797801 RepID=A0A1F5N2E6_9BACT|nr:MAG: hypothetical protein A2617_00795 [Candidatus Daviesbacteria bacterium RIFOXYD1_FULL_41_10]
MQQLLNQILQDNFTQDAALRTLRELKEQALLLLFGNSQVKQTAWMEGITKDNAYEIFDAIEAEIKKIEPLVIYMPCDISGEKVALIGTKARQLFGNNFLLEIKSDPGLLAGPAFAWNGVYKDYSVREKLAGQKGATLWMLKEAIRKQ